MNQTTLQQKLLAFDISALSSNDDFTKLFELLAQIEDKGFIQRIQQKLDNNLAFKDFAKMQPDVVQHLNRENNHSSRLAGLVSEKQKNSLKSTSIIGNRTILQQQIQNIIFGGAYIEGIKQAFDLDFSFGLKTSNELLQNLLNQGNLKDGSNILATIMEKALKSPEEIANHPEKIAESKQLAAQMSAKAFKKGDKKTAFAAAMSSEMFAILENDPTVGEQFNQTINIETLKNNSDSKINIFKDSCSLEEAVETVKLFGKEENLKELKEKFLHEFENDGEANFNQVRKTMQERFKQDLIEFASQKILNQQLTIKEFDAKISTLLDGIHHIYNDEDDIFKSTEITLDTIKEISDQWETNGFAQIIYEQFSSISLYYVNAKREMEENPEKYPSFIDFFNSEAGQKGSGKEFLDNPLIKQFMFLRKIDEISGTSYEEELRVMLRIPEHLLNTAIEANKLLAKEMAQKGLELSDLNTNNENKITIYEMLIEDENTVEKKLSFDERTEQENVELQAKNPDWEDKLKQKYNSQKNEQAHNSESLKSVRDNADISLTEDDQQIKKEEVKVSLFEITESFSTNRNPSPDKVQQYAHSI